MRSGVALAIAVFVAAPAVPAFAQPSPASADDIAVFKAILQNKIQPEAARHGSGPAAPLAVVDRTISLCGSNRSPDMRCFEEETLRTFLSLRVWENPNGGGDPITREIRDELQTSFLARNAESHPVPAGSIDGVTLTPSSRLKIGIAHASFGSPAYSRDGHALVLASYVCGNVCGYGWMFLLERRGTEWRVVTVDMLWIS